MIDISELRKSMYPNCLLEDRKKYAYSLEENRCIDATGKIICYLTYFFCGESYYFMPYPTLQTDEYSYSPIFIFQVVFPGDDIEDLERDPWFYSRKFSDHYKCDLAFDDNPDPRILSEDDFPVILPEFLSSCLKGEDMGMMEGKYSYLRNRYLHITSGECEEWALGEDEVLNPQKYSTLVRIIRHGDNEFEVDVNSSRESYDYEDYWVWFFAIPPSLIPVETSVKLLLENFKKTYFKSQH